MAWTNTTSHFYNLISYGKLKVTLESDLRSSKMSRGVGVSLVTGVSGKPIGPTIF
jgi:hypothetical protein